MNKLCISCKKEINNDAGSVEFSCPSCGETSIIRCTHCRDVGANYICQNCNFEGP